MNNLAIAKETGLPVLFKDFVIDPVQIKAAKHYGADCILLIMKVMDRLNLDVNSFIDLAHENGLDVLLECYNANEMKRAAKTKADVLGINNRDLQTLKVDLNRTKDILAASGTINKPVISESGIKSYADAKFVKVAGANGILVGSALWKADNQEAKIRELKGVL